MVNAKRSSAVKLGRKGDSFFSFARKWKRRGRRFDMVEVVESLFF